MASNQPIKRTNRSHRCRQHGPNLSGMPCVFPIEFERRERKRIQSCEILGRSLASVGPIVELMRDDGRKRKILRLVSLEHGQQILIALHDGYDSIGVE